MIDSIQTDLFELRCLCPEDRAEFVRIHEISREHFAPWMPRPDPEVTLHDLFEDELARAENGRAEGTEVRMVASLPDRRLAGVFALSQIHRRSFQNAYAAWRVSSDQVGRGIATRGLVALLDLAFAPRDQRRVAGPSDVREARGRARSAVPASSAR